MSVFTANDIILIYGLQKIKTRFHSENNEKETKKCRLFAFKIHLIKCHAILKYVINRENFAVKIFFSSLQNIF